MKISTKFVGISAVLVGAIALISGGSSLWRNHIEATTLEKYAQTQRRIRLTTLVKSQLQAEMLELKDHVLFRNLDEEKEEDADEDFNALFDELKALTPVPEVEFIRNRHEMFEELEENLMEAITRGDRTTLLDSQYDFRAINGLSRDIDFFLDKLVQQAKQQSQQAELELRQVREIATTISYATIVLLILMVLGVFWLILRPLIHSLKQLQAGASAIGSGQLSHRLNIHTQDEIQQVAQSFNQMAENLTQAQTLLQQKLAELEMARAAAETANRTKGEFLANMNHELRTPLNGILGYAQILQRDPATPAKSLRGIGVIYQCASHLLTLINDILDLSKLEAQKMELYPQDFHLANFLSSTVDICRVKAEQKGVEFRYQPGASLPTAVHADDKRLRQVLLNLLSNAVKFTDSGIVTFRVELADSPASPVLNSPAQSQRLRFQVKDTGIGIPAAKVDTIFLPFEQAGQRDRNSEGTGLGLAISQQIIEKMGSTIQIKSVLGEGSTFWFEIDLLPASDWMTGQAIVNQKVIGYQGDRRKILVIDDRAENRLVAIHMLEPLGFELAEADDGQAGLDLAIQLHPDLIITDVHMAQMDGLEMTRRLRQLPDFATTPIIASPATLSQVDMQASLDAGCNSFFPKPIEFNGLVAEIHRLLKLQWIYETLPDTTDAATSHGNEPNENGDLVFPPAAELVALYTAVQGGFMSDVQQEANRIKQLAPKYVPLANRLLELSQQFDDEGMLRLLAPWV
ncbi:MAG: response regulator [Leptolyngbyaceae cyanobacterium CSU_1_3]|nr:response regulator [Leptolyngbyaceae cyanobacterium CSU_1_3]